MSSDVKILRAHHTGRATLVARFVPALKEYTRNLPPTTGSITLIAKKAQTTHEPVQLDAVPGQNGRDGFEMRFVLTRLSDMAYSTSRSSTSQPEAGLGGPKTC